MHADRDEICVQLGRELGEAARGVTSSDAEAAPIEADAPLENNQVGFSELTPMTTRPMCIHCSDEDQSRILHIARASVVYCRIMREGVPDGPAHRFTRESGWGLTLQHFRQLTNGCSLGQS